MELRKENLRIIDLLISRIFFVFLFILFCKPENIPPNAKYNAGKNIYTYSEMLNGKLIEYEWDKEGDSKKEKFKESGKEITHYYRFNELLREEIIEKISTTEIRKQIFNMHKTLLQEEIKGIEETEITNYNWDGSFRERIVYKNGKNQKLPPKVKAETIPRTAQFNYTFRAWENGVLINNKKYGVWKLWLPTGEEYGFITYQNDIFHGRMFLKIGDVVYVDIIMKEGKVFASPYLEKKAIEFHKNKTNELEERDFPIKEISEFTGLTEKQILEYRKSKSKK